MTPSLSEEPTNDSELRADHYNCAAMKIASMPGGGITIKDVHDAIEALLKADRQKLIERIQRELDKTPLAYAKEAGDERNAWDCVSVESVLTQLKGELE